jgi:alpha-galactosidase/6-phospho-beta-glucosidase family protein
MDKCTSRLRMLGLCNAPGLWSNRITDRLSYKFAVRILSHRVGHGYWATQSYGESHAAMDKARQIYHTRGSPSWKKIKSQEAFTLFSLLEHRRGFTATDPRDVVFSLYGVIDEANLAAEFVPVDYERTTVEVYTDVASAILISACTTPIRDPEPNRGWEWGRLNGSLINNYSIFAHVENGR